MHKKLKYITKTLPSKNTQTQRHSFSSTLRLTEVDSEVVLRVDERVQHLAVDVLDGVLVALLDQPLQHFLLLLDVPWTHTQTNTCSVTVMLTQGWDELLSGMHSVLMLLSLTLLLLFYFFYFFYVWECCTIRLSWGSLLLVGPGLSWRRQVFIVASFSERLQVVCTNMPKFPSQVLITVCLSFLNLRHIYVCVNKSKPVAQI